MFNKRKIGALYLLVLWALISASAWPAYILCSTLLSVYVAEGWQLGAWQLLPRRELINEFFIGYKASVIISIPLGFIAVIDYLLLSRYKATWLFGGILLPVVCGGIAFGFYHQPDAAFPALLATGVLLAIIHRLLDIVVGQGSRGRLR